MDIPFPGTTRMLTGGKLLLIPDGHEFRQQRDSMGNKFQYVCHMGTKNICKATATVGSY